MVRTNRLQWRLQLADRPPAHLSDYCYSISDGDHQTPPKADFGTPFITISAMNDGRLDLSKATRYVPRSYFDGLHPARRAQTGDVLYSVTGSFGIPARVESDTPFVFQRHIALLRPDPEICDSKWLAYLLAAPQILEQSTAIATGTAQLTVPLTGLRNLEVPVTTLAEQRRIVAKLDAMTARLAGARAELEQVLVLAANLKNRALVDAFSGSATADWRTSQVTLRPVEPRPAQAIRAKFQSQEAVDGPYLLPAQWRWLRLPELGDLDRGKSRHRPRNDPSLFGGDHPFIQTGDVRTAGQYLTSYTETYSDFGLDQSRKWPVGTVCITIAANIAETCILGIPACFPDSVVGFTADGDKAIPEYIEYFIRTAKTDLARFAPATAQKNINLEILASVTVPVPPLEEQREVLRRINAAFARADRLEAEATRARALLDRLESALLAKAFRGELVQQDPNDEPAQTLLDRIRTGRAAAPKAKRGRRKSMG